MTIDQQRDINNFDSLLELIDFLDEGGNDSGYSYQEFEDLGK